MIQTKRQLLWQTSQTNGKLRLNYVCVFYNKECDEMIQCIPTPKHIDGMQVKLTKCIFKPIVCCRENIFIEATTVFVGYAEKLFGLKFEYDEGGLFEICRKTDLKNGQYIIQSEKNSVSVHAGDLSGLHNAFSVILQIAEQADNMFVLPEVTITDQSDCVYRGMMVDLARCWHPFQYLLQYVDMCYFYRVNILHLHFTDSQSYTLPSDCFPKLSTKEQHYTKDEIKKLNEYACARGVMIVPEIDVPGHCEPFQQSYPELFGTSGIICQHNDSIRAMQDLFSELCQMFPNSEYIHIGGDEAEIKKWAECTACRKYGKSLGINPDKMETHLFAERMYANFVQKMADVVFENGKIPIAWEGFSKEVNEYVSKDILLMSWENYYQTAPELLKAGFRIVNCSWNPLYVVTSLVCWEQKNIYDWSIYEWQPVHGGSPYLHTGLEIDPDSDVCGGQLLAWGDQISSHYIENVEQGVIDERNLLLERLPFLAENTWNIRKQRPFEEVKASYDILCQKLRKLIE